MDTRNAVKLVQFVDSIHVSCSPEVDVFRESSRNDLLRGRTHDFFQSSIDYILLGCAFQ